MVELPTSFAASMRRCSFLIAVCVMGCASAPRLERSVNAEVVLLSFGSLQGEFTSEQGHAGDAGGLARRAGYLKALRERAGNVLHLDLGDFTTPPSGRDSRWVSTDLVWDQMISMGVDASVPGALELTDWRDYVRRIESGRIPIVCSNLSAIEDGQERAIGEPWRVVAVNGVRVGLFGLVSEAAVQDARPPSGVTFRYRAPIDVAREIVPELRRRADIVVLLAQLESTELDQLVTEVPGIDVALSGRRSAWVEEAERVGGTLVQRTGIRGMYAGRLHLIVDPRGSIVQALSLNQRLGVDQAPDPEVYLVVDQVMADGLDEWRRTHAAERSRRNDPAFNWRSPEEWLRVLAPKEPRHRPREMKERN